MIRVLLLLFTLRISAILSASQVLGLGAPCLDYIIEVQEEDLARYGLSKGGWHTVDAEEIAAIVSQNDHLVFSGDCVSNTIKGAAALGLTCSLTGNIGTDPSGELIQQIFQKSGVKTLFTETTTPTSKIACLITPDGERSFCAFVDAEREITEKELKSDHFKDADLVHLSGYRLPNGPYSEIALAMAKQAGVLTSYDLGNAQLVDAYRERLWALIPAAVDIVFANEQEAYALTQLPPKEAATFIKNFCEIAIVKVGDQGCWVCSEDGIFHSPAVKAQVVDSTGAGDLFASAFLYAYLKGASLPDCASIANIAGSAAVEDYGAQLSPARWTEIREYFENSASLK